MRIVFAGTPEFAVPSLRILLSDPGISSRHQICAVYTQPDRPSGRGKKLQPSPVKVLAETAGIPVYQPESLKTESDILAFAELKPDLFIVVAYGMILPQAVLDIPVYGCLNVHGSLLPRWRGAAPIQRALMAGDTETGVTIMRIIQKLDAGDMLHKETCPIGDHDTSADLYAKLAELGALGLAKVILQLEQGALTPEQQDETLVTYAEKLGKHEARIDWSLSAVDLSRKIRGLNPWPVAQTEFSGQSLRIWQAEPLPSSTTAEPGTVLSSGKTLDVATGNGVLRLLEVQLPGGKRLPAQAFINSHPIEGVRLG